MIFHATNWIFFVKKKKEFVFFYSIFFGCKQKSPSSGFYVDGIEGIVYLKIQRHSKRYFFRWCLFSGNLKKKRPGDVHFYLYIIFHSYYLIMIICLLFK